MEVRRFEMSMLSRRKNRNGYISVVRYLMGINCLFFVLSLEAQTLIKLINPSFEDTPIHSVAPAGWIDCGFPGESPPDIQPNGQWKVHRPPYHGVSYLGMVTRENDTWERVAQMLSDTLQPNQCYYFNIYLCTSPVYKSAVKELGEEDVPQDPELKDFTDPIRLRIWGGDNYCSYKELLDQSPTVVNNDWKVYHFKFQPKVPITHLVLEAFYKTPTLFPYNGNILLDKASDIQPIECDQERPEILAPIVEFLQPIEKLNPAANLVRVTGRVRYVESQNDLRFVVNNRSVRNFKFDASKNKFEATLTLNPGRNDFYLYGRNEGGADSDQTTVYIQQEELVADKSPTPDVMEEDKIPETPGDDSPEKPLRYEKLEKLNYLSIGQSLQIDNLRFAVNSDSIYDSSIPELQEVYNFLVVNSNYVIEISGHTSLPLKKQYRGTKKYFEDLSLNRAKAVAKYLIDKGIPQDRILCRGYGFSKPLVSNWSSESHKNQRVEIKILGTG